MIYLKSLWTFFKIGLFTIGGGYAMIPMIKSEVIAVGWLTEGELLDFMAISESTPGPFAVNVATFVGFNEAGLLGAFVSTLGIILPSFIIILIVSKIVNKFLNNKYVNYALTGVRPVVVGLILAVAVSLIYSGLLNSEFVLANLSFGVLIIMVIVFTLSRFKKTKNPILLISISAVLGIILFGLIGIN